MHAALGCQKVGIDAGFCDGDFIPLAHCISSRLNPQVTDMTKAIDEYRSPPHKIIAMLKKGRDDLREKYRELMKHRRAAENQVRAVEKSRETWRMRAEAAEAELRELKKKLNRAP